MPFELPPFPDRTKVERRNPPAEPFHNQTLMGRTDSPAHSEPEVPMFSADRLAHRKLVKGIRVLFF